MQRLKRKGAWGRRGQVSPANLAPLGGGCMQGKATHVLIAWIATWNHLAQERTSGERVSVVVLVRVYPRTGKRRPRARARSPCAGSTFSAAPSAALRALDI